MIPTKAMRAANDGNFWGKYHRLRSAKLPVDSKVYEHLETLYASKRRDFNKVWKTDFQRQLPPATIRYYNELFARGEVAVMRVFKKFPVSKRSMALARNAYSIRLAPGSTLADLLKLDVFGEKTINQDIHPEIVFKDMRKIYTKEPTLISDTHHFFFHRPQQSQHIFLHEIIVGYLLNEVERPEHHYTAATLPLSTYDYPGISAYTLFRLAKAMKMSPGQIVALHFESNETLTKKLPRFVQDLMLIASHIYWYLDIFTKKSGRFSPAELLSFSYSYFVVPSLERYRKENDLRLRAGSGRRVEEIMTEGILSGDTSQVSAVELVHTLLRFSESLWR